MLDMDSGHNDLAPLGGNLQNSHDQALVYVDEPTYRVWRVSMSYLAYSYTIGQISIYQAMLVKQDTTDANNLP